MSGFAETSVEQQIALRKQMMKEAADLVGDFAGGTGLSPLTGATLLLLTSIEMLRHMGGPSARPYTLALLSGVFSPNAKEGAKHQVGANRAMLKMAEHFDLMTMKPGGEA